MGTMGCIGFWVERGVGPLEITIQTYSMDEDHPNYFVIPTSGGSFNAVIDWGDGDLQRAISVPGPIEHNYSSAGQFHIKIYGIFPFIVFSDTPASADNVISIDAWGDSQHMSTGYCAYNICTNMVANFTDVPDISRCTDSWGLYYMFCYCVNLKTSFASCNIEPIGNLEGFLYGCDINEHNTTSNYDNTLISWAMQNVKNNVLFDAGNSKYSAAAVSARDHLINVHGWTINDGGLSE